MDTRETDELVEAARDVWRRGQLVIDEAKKLRRAALRTREKSQAVRASMASEHERLHWPEYHTRSEQHCVSKRRPSAGT